MRKRCACAARLSGRHDLPASSRRRSRTSLADLDRVGADREYDLLLKPEPEDDDDEQAQELREMENSPVVEGYGIGAANAPLHVTADSRLPTPLSRT
jgi:hypothetical protein